MIAKAPMNRAIGYAKHRRCVRLKVAYTSTEGDFYRPGDLVALPFVEAAGLVNKGLASPED